jgi:hypothetical protein
LLLIFAQKPLIVRIFLRPPEVEVSTLVLSLLKEIGGMVLMLGVLPWLASGNPVRNVAVVDALIAGLCILAAVNQDIRPLEDVLLQIPNNEKTVLGGALVPLYGFHYASPAREFRCSPKFVFA